MLNEFSIARSSRLGADQTSNSGNQRVSNNRRRASVRQIAFRFEAPVSIANVEVEVFGALLASFESESSDGAELVASAQ